LDFIIISDLTTNKPKYPHFCLRCGENESFIIEGNFSGADHLVEKEIAGRALMFNNPAPYLMLKSSTIKGIHWPRIVSIPQQNLRNRPKGTIMLFKFLIGISSYLLKGFVNS
jgi:hypothetical protein